MTQGILWLQTQEDKEPAHLCVAVLVDANQVSFRFTDSTHGRANVWISEKWFLSMSVPHRGTCSHTKPCTVSFGTASR